MQCPNKQLQIWKDLVAKYGEFSAMKAYVLNKEDIPTIEEADTLLKGITYNQFNDIVQDLKARFNVVGTKYDSFAKASDRAKGINDYINKQETPVPYRAKASKNTAGDYIVTFVPSTDNTLYRQVDYNLRLVEGLKKIQRNRFESSKLQGWLNDIQKLGVTKEQLDMFKESAKDGMTKDEILASILANYSYTVEINTAKEKTSMNKEVLAVNGFNINNDYYKIENDTSDPFGFDKELYTKNGKEITETEYRDALYVYNHEHETSTQYYSNLTVPGGTNYTENEIKTPQITPNIKGHAQFSTDNGIGWFRSDEQLTKEQSTAREDYALRDTPFASTNTIQIVNTKTRRILEVQSDLFQKGRDNPFLYEKEGKQTALGTQIIDSTENQFLQLLNKDSNWVTFFIKSIIQDSAKKGYEKVLFPKGETAAKVEGHETLANELIKLNKLIEDPSSSEFEISEGDYGYRYGQQGVDLFSRDKEDFIKKLEQRKSELKSQGVEKLKPIEAFYEIKVGNILRKQYSVKEIVDEYGNGWYEINIANEKSALQPILLHKYPMLGGEVKSDYEEKKQLFQKTLGIEVIEDPSLTDLGIVTTINGKRIIKINPLLATRDTIGHEFGHILIDIIGGVENPLCKRGLKLLEGSVLEKKVRELYPDVSEEILKHEILAQAIGEDSVRLFEEESKRTAFENWLVRLFERIRQLLGIEKSTVRRLTRMMFDGPKNIEDTVPDLDTEYEQRSSEYMSDKKLVKKAIDLISNKKALYEHMGYHAAIARMDELLLDMATKDHKEALMKFVSYADRQTHAINILYNKELAKEKEGKKAFDIAVLKKWNEYLSAFEILDDISTYLIDNPEIAISPENKARLNEIISKRNHLRSLYTTKGHGKLVDWLMPYSTRTEAEIKRDIEHKYNTLPKEERSKISLIEYQNQELALRTDEIDERKRSLIETELEKARADINQIYRWGDNLLDSNDVIISATVKALVTADESARLRSTKARNKIIEALRELETVIKHNMVEGEEKFYDYLLDKDSEGKYTGYLISEFKSSLVTDYYTMKNKADSIEDPQSRLQFIKEWYKKNVPINRGKLKDNLKAYYNEFVVEGQLTESDVAVLMEKFDAGYYSPIRYKTDSELIGQEKADLVAEGMGDILWRSRDIPEKYRNKEWEKFDQLRRKDPTDPRVKFYNLIVKLADEADKNLPSKYKLNFHGLLYRLPSVGKDTRERVKDKGFKGWLTAQKVGLVKRPEDIERGQEELVGENNEPIDFVPVFYTQHLPIEDMSFDVANIYAKFYDMSVHYEAKSEILPQMELARYFIKNREVVKTDSKGNPIKNALRTLEDKELTKSGQQSLIAAQFEDWYKTIMYGQSKADEGNLNVFGFQIDKGKAMDMLGRYSAFNLLALNAIQGFGNVLLGETMQSIEAFAGEYMTVKAYNKANLVFSKNFVPLLGDIGARKPSSFLGVLNEEFSIVNDSGDPLRRSTKFRSLLTSNSLFFMQHAGEFEMQVRFFLGMLADLDARNANNKVVGKMIDYISVKDGELIIDKEVKNFDEKERILFGQKVKRVLSRMHGEYSNYGAVALQRYGIGRLVLAFRKFIIPGFKRRWSSEAYNEFSNSFTEGNYITTARFAKILIKDFKAFKLSLARAEWEKLTQAEKANIYRTLSEVAFMTAAIILSTIFLSLAKAADDDDEDRKWSFAAYQASRYMSEIQFFVNPVAALSILRSPMASMSVVENSIKLLSQLADPTERYERGPWKDELKIKKDLINLTIGVRQYYRLRDIEQQLNYFNQ